MPYIPFEDKQLYYESYGEGSPLLLLNGIMMSTASWKPFILSLSCNFRLLLVDFLDQGKSSDMEEPYTQAVQVKAVLTLLDTLNLEKASVAGISYGGEVALAFAAEHPERIERLMLFNCGARTTPLLRDIGRSWNKAAETQDGLSYYLSTIPVIYSPEFYEAQEKWMESRQALLVPHFAREDVRSRLVRLTDSAEDYDVRDKLHKVNMPALIVSSESDMLIPQSEQQYLADRLPDAHYVLMKGCGHASMYERPLLFTALINGFALSAKPLDV